MENRRKAQRGAGKGLRKNLRFYYNTKEGKTMKKQGDRIGAILSAKDNMVKFLGYGVYLGEETPPDLPIPNPKLQMDNGAIVWGYQCWWGGESAVKSQIEKYKKAGWIIEEVFI